MTGAQASYLKTLCEKAHIPEAFDEGLTEAEASKLIDEMRKQAGLSEMRCSSSARFARSKSTKAKALG